MKYAWYVISFCHLSARKMPWNYNCIFDMLSYFSGYYSPGLLSYQFTWTSFLFLLSLTSNVAPNAKTMFHQNYRATKRIRKIATTQNENVCSSVLFAFTSNGALCIFIITTYMYDVRYRLDKFNLIVDHQHLNLFNNSFSSFDFIYGHFIVELFLHYCDIYR